VRVFLVSRSLVRDHRHHCIIALTYRWGAAIGAKPKIVQCLKIYIVSSRVRVAHKVQRREAGPRFCIRYPMTDFTRNALLPENELVRKRIRVGGYPLLPCSGTDGTTHPFRRFCFHAPIDSLKHTTTQALSLNPASVCAIEGDRGEMGSGNRNTVHTSVRGTFFLFHLCRSTRDLYVDCWTLVDRVRGSTHFGQTREYSHGSRQIDESDMRARQHSFPSREHGSKMG
jgi:hypothetical protein